MTPIRWGLLGAGQFAQKFSAPAINAAIGAELAAIGSRSIDKVAKVKAFAPHVEVETSYSTILERDDIDAIYVALPNHLHAEWTIAAMQAGKHVLCEKPLAMNVTEIDTMIAKRDASGCLASEAFMVVHHPQWQRAKTLLDQGSIGRILHVDGHFSFFNDDRSNIRNRPETGGGGLRDLGVYLFGTTIWACNEESVQISHAELDWERGVDVQARISGKCGPVSAHWVGSMRMQRAQHVTFYGTEGTLRLGAPFNANVYDVASLELRQGTQRFEERFPATQQYVLQFEAFNRAIATGERFPWQFEDARRAQAVIDRILETYTPKES